MNNPKTTSRIWKDSIHVKGSEHRQEVKNAKSFRSYHNNPKQKFRKGRKRDEHKMSSRTIQLIEMERGLLADGNYTVKNGINVAWICETSVIVGKPKNELMPSKFNWERLENI